MNWNLKISATLLLTFAFFGIANSATLSVPQQYTSLELALDSAQPGDVINLAPGVYFESELILPGGVTISGTGSSADAVVLDAQNLGRIMIAESLSRETSIENITFRNGRAFGETSYDQSGGAILCSNSLMRIVNCIFTENQAEGHGGAIRCNNSSPLIDESVFSGNSALKGGGAIDCSYDSYPTIDDCRFLDNTADWGGALSCRGDSSPMISGATFEGNTAEGERAFGGAVFVDYFAEPIFSKTVFSDNQAAYGGAAACFEDSKINLDGCTVVANESHQEGGGLFLRGAAPQIFSTIITFNEGLGISTDATAYPELSCSDIYGNTLGDWEGTFGHQQGQSGNLSVDPLFCSTDMGNINRFFLRSDSPVADPEGACDTMGAKAVGCQMTTEVDPVPAPLDLGRVTAYPNPFNPSTAIQFELGQQQHVRVSIFNLQGSLVRTLADEVLGSGDHNIRFDGRDNSGRTIGSGAYIVVVESTGHRQTQKLTMLK